MHPLRAAGALYEHVARVQVGRHGAALPRLAGDEAAAHGHNTLNGDVGPKQARLHHMKNNMDTWLADDKQQFVVVGQQIRHKLDPRPPVACPHLLYRDERGVVRRRCTVLESLLAACEVI
jgi:hypothetical protein